MTCIIISICSSQSVDIRKKLEILLLKEYLFLVCHIYLLFSMCTEWIYTSGEVRILCQINGSRTVCGFESLIVGILNQICSLPKHHVLSTA